MRSKRSGKSVRGGLTATPMTEKSASRGNNLAPRFPAMPVTTTIGFELAISPVSTPEAVPRVAAEPEADLERPEPSDAGGGAEADAFPPVPPAQNKPRWFPF